MNELIPFGSLCWVRTCCWANAELPARALEIKVFHSIATNGNQDQEQNLEYGERSQPIYTTGLNWGESHHGKYGKKLACCVTANHVVMGSLSYQLRRSIQRSLRTDNRQGKFSATQASQLEGIESPKLGASREAKLFC
jgi:hypothetical protein